MTEDIEAELIEYIRTQILKRPKYELSGEDALISSGLIDSFHRVDLAVFIEDRFGVRIDDTELTSETFDTLSQLVELVRHRMG